MIVVLLIIGIRGNTQSIYHITDCSYGIKNASTGRYEWHIGLGCHLSIIMNVNAIFIGDSVFRKKVFMGNNNHSPAWQCESVNGSQCSILLDSSHVFGKYKNHPKVSFFIYWPPDEQRVEVFTAPVNRKF